MRATIVAIALSCTAVSAGEAVAGRLEAENVPLWSGVYAGASLSIGRGASDASEVTCDATLCNGAQTTSVSEATTKSPTWGVLLGAGLEQKFNDRWSGRLEYRYMDFRKELALPAIDGPGWNQHVDVHALSIGLSYRF